MRNRHVGQQHELLDQPGQFRFTQDKEMNVSKSTDGLARFGADRKPLPMHGEEEVNMQCILCTPVHLSEIVTLYKNY